ncbi:uridine phosphorylase [Thecamonas trahens ATCC 50062]|uniref:Uridine phosphorylase n=1 Tax=Thecamonas trahens ATCC 50062 TaxID=461836 RepID=A0A0L0DC03_THETB|nr:uridine phosphorylase [Thecamonas trahens ATCC 50062]KNC48838.1 uridine phosphorylase [Thecamonas trahens ATCC 50062]|eukprot:XP_013758258.1 uridine phosphorylase [Thecamonas trahens ATCC 50062]
MSPFLRLSATTNKRELENPAESGSPVKKAKVGSDGLVALNNRHLVAKQEEAAARGEVFVDHLYHLGLDSSMPLQEQFGKTRFVVMGGSPVRALDVAQLVYQFMGVAAPQPIEPFGKTERYSMYNCQLGEVNVLSISHGMGQPSLSICLHEMAKLMHYAKARNVAFIRVGTSGGVGVAPGTCVVAKSAVSGLLEPFYSLDILGKTHQFPANFDSQLADDILACAGDDIAAVAGITCGTDCFYEGQGRLDGMVADYSRDDKLAFLQKAHEAGVTNFEMESTCLAAQTSRWGISAALVCTTLLNRLDGDQVTSTPEQLKQFSLNAQTLVLRYIKKQLIAEGLLPADA